MMIMGAGAIAYQARGPRGPATPGGRAGMKAGAGASPPVRVSGPMRPSRALAISSAAGPGGSTLGATAATLASEPSHPEVSCVVGARRAGATYAVNIAPIRNSPASICSRHRIGLFDENRIYLS